MENYEDLVSKYETEKDLARKELAQHKENCKNRYIDKEQEKAWVKAESAKAKTARKITKKVMYVKIMNEYEKAKAQGTKELLKFIANHLYISAGAKRAVEFFGEEMQQEFKDNWEKYNFGEKLLTCVGTPMAMLLQAPLVTGFILITLGVTAIELYKIIKSSPEIEKELKDIGKYDWLISNLEKVIAKEHKENISELYGDIVTSSTNFTDDLLYGSGRNL